MPEFDLAVIGAGAAGLSVTYAAARLGARVLLVERGRMGGDCLNTGCVPSKALLAASHAARAARRAGRFGVHVAEPHVDWEGVRAHVQGAIARIAPADSAERYRGLGVTVLHGHARLTPDAQLAVDGRRHTARHIVIAAGSRPAVPPIPGLAGSPYLTNETLFDLPHRPEHLLILGGGAIGLEMAQAHAGLGCRVTLVESGRIGAAEDADQADALRTVLRADGVTLIEGARVTAVEPEPALVLSDGRRVTGSHLLIASGRTPNLEDFGLAEAGVRVTARGIATDAGLRSLSHRHVYAAGDIADPAGLGPVQLTHAASYHAGIIIRRALFRLPARLDYRALPRVIYTNPEWAVAGMTEKAAQTAGLSPRVLRWTLAETDRAVAEAETAGSAVLVVSGRGALLGASLLAPGAGEAIGLWVQAIGRKVPLQAVAGMVLPYPSFAEAGKRAAGLPSAERLFSPPVRRVVRLLSLLP